MSISVAGRFFYFLLYCYSIYKAVNGAYPQEIFVVMLLAALASGGYYSLVYLNAVYSIIAWFVGGVFGVELSYSYIAISILFLFFNEELSRFEKSWIRKYK